MSASSLQRVLDAAPSTVELLRNSQLGAYISFARFPVDTAKLTGAGEGGSMRAWRLRCGMGGRPSLSP
jgi:mevalonate kinase